MTAARAEITKLQRVLGKKTLENEILKEAVEIAAAKKMDCALALVARGRPMKPVCSVLGVARSNLHVRHHRPGHWQESRKGRTPAQGEALLLASIKESVATVSRTDI